MKHKLSLLATLALGILGLTAQAVQIDWGNAVAATPDRVFNSSGNPVDTNLGQYTFALGTFGSFMPTVANTAQWFGNWKVLDTTALDNPSIDYFTNSVTLDDNKVFAANEEAYMFIYRTEAAGVTEASLFRSTDWNIPVADVVHALPFNWRTPQVDTLVFGGVNAASGPGGSTSTPSTFDVQLHRLPSPIPEPSTGLFGLLALGLTSLRRRR